MPNEEILSEMPISMAEMKKELESIEKRDKELNLRAGKTLEYINQFIKLKEKETEELHKKLEKLNVPRLREQYIKKIMDVMPTTVDDLKVVLQGYTLSVNNDNLKKIVKVIKEFTK